LALDDNLLLNLTLMIQYPQTIFSSFCHTFQQPVIATQKFQLQDQDHISTVISRCLQWDADTDTL